MNYRDLLKMARRAPLLKIKDISSPYPLKPHEWVQLNSWTKKGLLVRLKRGIYTLPDSERAYPLAATWLANQLYWPSYVSLQYALSFYGLIPEAVGAITSVSTLKTTAIKNSLGVFLYKKVQPRYFFGFKTIPPTKGPGYWMATAEKALLDFIYLDAGKKSEMTSGLLTEGYRLQNLETLNVKILKQYLEKFDNVKVQKAGQLILALIDKRAS